jgi:hypothetical protein
MGVWARIYKNLGGLTFGYGSFVPPPLYWPVLSHYSKKRLLYHPSSFSINFASLSKQDQNATGQFVSTILCIGILGQNSKICKPVNIISFVDPSLQKRENVFFQLSCAPAVPAKTEEHVQIHQRQHGAVSVRLRTAVSIAVQVSRPLKH